MEGLEIRKFPNRFCSLCLASALSVVAGTAIAAEEEAPVATAVQIEQERTAQINSAVEVSVKAAELAQEGRYSEADAAYSKSLAMLEVLPGSAARQESDRIAADYAAMRKTWFNAIMREASDLADQGEYGAAVDRAGDALMADGDRADEVLRFIDRCDARVKAEEFKKATDIETVRPQQRSEEEQIDLLFRQTAVLERAHRYTEAVSKLEEVFMLDPLSFEANKRLRRVYNKLYGAGKLQSDGVIRGISANASWTYVPQVVADRVKMDEARTDNERDGANDLYRKLEKILVTADYQDESVLDVIDEQNRNLLRGAPDSRASIILQFPQQLTEKLPKITLQAVDLPLIDLLRYVCMQADLKMKVEENAIVLGLGSSFDDLSTRSFKISATIIQDIAEGQNPYYHLGNVITATEEGSSGGGGRGGVAGGGAVGGGGSAIGSVSAGGPMDGAATGMAFGTGANTRVQGTQTGRNNINQRTRTTSTQNRDPRGVSGGLGSIGLSMDTLGIDSSSDSNSDDRDEMGGLGTPTPPITTESLVNYFRARGIEFEGGADITYNRRKGEILVTNTVENLRKMEDLLSQLDAFRSPLVMVDAKVVELSDTDVKELGFDWYFNVDRSAEDDAHWTIPGNEQPLRHYSSEDENSHDGTDRSYRIVNGLKLFPNFGESIFGKNSNVNLSLTVNAIDQSTRSEILSAPRLLLTSGDLGLIKMVENVKYPESWDAPEIDIDGDTVDITAPVPEFDDGNDIGVVFACRPIVNPDNYTISLYLYPQVTAYLGHANSEYDIKLEAGTVYTQWVNGSATTVKVPNTSTTVQVWMPEIAVREMEVNVQVYDGATVVLGGMTEQYNTERSDKWPVLGEVPLLGRLFSSQMSKHDKRSLLIFVTARLMNEDGTPWRGRESFGVPEFLW